MKKYKFSTTERFVIWKAYENKCFWCGEPIDFKEITIDHLFPEKLLSDSNELDLTKRNYALPQDFHINDFGNWVPAHNICNAKKSISILKNSPMFLLSIERVQQKSIKIKKSYKDLIKKISNDKLIAKLLSDLENERISDMDLLTLIERTSKFYYNPPEIDKSELTHLPEGWKVMSIDRENRTLRVTNGKAAGTIPIDISPYSNWWCAMCHNCGPWNGNRCISCGHLNSPD